jgi:hypothetical protein
MTKSHEPGAAIERGTEVMAIAELDIANVDRHANPQWSRLLPHCVGEPALCSSRRVRCVFDSRERRVYGVADGLKYRAVSRLDGAAQYHVMKRDGLGVRALVSLEKAGAAFNISEQERHCSSWQFGQDDRLSTTPPPPRSARGC